MNEHSFSSKILKKCRESGIKKVWKINDAYQGGVPDAWFLGNKNDLWIEFKWIKELPKRESTIIKPNLSALQVSWLTTLQASGKQAVVVVGYPKRAVILHTPNIWKTGVTTDEFDKLSVTHNELVDWIMHNT